MKKKYTYVALILIVLVLISFSIDYTYNKYKNLKLKEPVIRGKLSEIKTPEELDFYITENNNIIIYISNNDEESRNFEYSFKKYLNKKKNNNDFIFYNIMDLNKEEIINNLNKKIKDGKIRNLPAFIIVKDKIFMSSLDNNNHDLTINKVNDFIKGFNIEK